MQLDEMIWHKIVEMGLALASKNDYQEAILHFNAALVANADNVNALYNMGRAFDDLYRENQDRKFLPFIKHCYERTIELEPTFGPAYAAIGFFYYNEEKYAQAEEAWIEALRYELSFDMREEIVSALGRVEDRAIFERGRERILNGRYEEGLETLKAIEDLHDDWWQLNFFIGLALKMQERYEDALPYFLKVLVLNSGFIQAMNEAGICLIAMGDYDQALQHYREALRLSPKNPEYLCNKGVVYYHMKAFDDAYIAIEEAHTLAPDDEVIQMWYQHIQQYVDFS
jgi:tetratricopeptide (TPR) repeat protein